MPMQAPALKKLLKSLAVGPKHFRDIYIATTLVALVLAGVLVLADLQGITSEVISVALLQICVGGCALLGVIGGRSLRNRIEETAPKGGGRSIAIAAKNLGGILALAVFLFLLASGRAEMVTSGMDSYFVDLVLSFVWVFLLSFPALALGLRAGYHFRDLWKSLLTSVLILGALLGFQYLLEYRVHLNPTRLFEATILVIVTGGLILLLNLVLMEPLRRSTRGHRVLLEFSLTILPILLVFGFGAWNTLRVHPRDYRTVFIIPPSAGDSQVLVAAKHWSHPPLEYAIYSVDWKTGSFQPVLSHLTFGDYRGPRITSMGDEVLVSRNEDSTRGRFCIYRNLEGEELFRFPIMEGEYGLDCGPSIQHGLKRLDFIPYGRMAGWFAFGRFEEGLSGLEPLWSGQTSRTLLRLVSEEGDREFQFVLPEAYPRFDRISASSFLDFTWEWSPVSFSESPEYGMWGLFHLESMDREVLVRADTNRLIVPPHGIQQIDLPSRLEGDHIPVRLHPSAPRTVLPLLDTRGTPRLVPRSELFPGVEEAVLSEWHVEGIREGTRVLGVDLTSRMGIIAEPVLGKVCEIESLFPLTEGTWSWSPDGKTVYVRSGTRGESHFLCVLPERKTLGVWPEDLSAPGFRSFSAPDSSAWVALSLNPDSGVRSIFQMIPQMKRVTLPDFPKGITGWDFDGAFWDGNRNRAVLYFRGSRSREGYTGSLCIFAIVDFDTEETLLVTELPENYDAARVDLRPRDFRPEAFWSGSDLIWRSASGTLYRTRIPEMDTRLIFPR